MTSGASGLAIARLPEQSGTVDAQVRLIGCQQADKPFMAAGPWPSLLPGGVTIETDEVVHTAWTNFDLGILGAHSTGADPQGLAWTSDPGLFGGPKPVEADSPPAGWTSETFGAFPLVLHSGLNPGRLIFAAGRTELPSVAVSDAGGETVGSEPRWKFPIVFEQYLDDEELRPIRPLPAPANQNALPGGALALTFPSVAQGLTDPNEVVIAFIATVDDYSSVTDVDSDIFIARSDDQGQTFTTFRITNAMLGISPSTASDEYMVSVALDVHGGINLLFLQTIDPAGTANADARVTVRYARWHSFADIENQETPYLSDLSEPHAPHPRPSGFHDYHMIITSGCHVYAAWCAQDVEGHGEPYQIFVNAVRLDTNIPPCLPDPECYANCDGSTTDPVLNVADFTCFLQTFAEGGDLPAAQQVTWYANCDQSTGHPALNVADFTCFLQKFAAGCM